MWRVTIGRIVMFRKITIGCAVVVAMLVAPATLPAQSMGGFGSMRGMSGGMHSMSGVMHSMGGVHSFGMASSRGGFHSFSPAAIFPRPHFARFHLFRIAHFHLSRHRHMFATAIVAGHGSCWRWVPTRFGWHRVWVCG